ncbi:MAG: recombination mediator RecR [Patescibacteria group bacterium]
MNNFFNELKSFFQKLPGIGPRQASRFVYTLVDLTKEDREKMGELISSLDKYLRRCGSCFRIFSVGGDVCSFCLSTSPRDNFKIMVVEKDSDLFNIEKTKLYNGAYFVLGKLFDPLEEAGIKERIDFLNKKIKKNEQAEVILALPPSKQGEFTCEYIKKIIGDKVFLSRLARGLSSGIDLEYADENTLRHALENRK